MINYQLEEIFNCYRYQSWGFPGGTMVKHPPANAGDTGSISGSGRSLGEGNGNPLQYSCLKNSIDRGAYSLQGYVDYSLYGLQAIVHRVAQSNMRERQHTPHTGYELGSSEAGYGKRGGYRPLVVSGSRSLSPLVPQTLH